MDSIKEVELGGERYIVKKMTPKAACWVFLMGRKLANGTLTEEEWDTVQNHCLRVVSQVSKVENVPPIPVVTPDGRLTCKELLEDAPAVLKLTMESYAFNINPFAALGSPEPGVGV